MRNLTLLTDLYELTMMQGYFKTDNNRTVIFDAFHRKNPCDGAYAISCGLEQVIDYIKNLHFTEDDIAYLRSLSIFDEDFLEYLSNFHFTGDIYAIPEGTVIFPREPIVKVIAPIMEAQLVETAILNIINHQSLIATKAARVCYAAKGDGIMEFGLRRAQGPDAGIYGARAAVIAGCVGTSNVLTGQMFGVPVKGTHAHSWIMSFPDEYTAFKTYADLYPNACILLVDTYDTLRSGVPNAIRVFKEMREKGIDLKGYGIRLDSGDIAYLTREARQMLDEAGWESCKISASNSLDEYDADGMIKADLITLADETYDESQPLLLFDPVETWKKTLMEPGEYSMREIMVKVFDKGECVYDSPNVMDIQKYCKQEQATLWDESKRLINPQVVHVDLSQKLYDLKQELLHNYGREKL